MKYCSSCGACLQDDMVFCPKCGNKFREAANDVVVDKQPGNLEYGQRKNNGKKKYVIAAIIVVFVMLAAAAFFLLNKDFSDNPKAISMATESVVKVYCYDYSGELLSTGSGFCVFDDSTFVTNYHVIDHAVDIRLSTEQDHEYIVDGVLAYDKERDIAILRTKDATGLNVLSFGDSSKIMKGETVTAIGSPLGIKNTVSTGVLSGRYYDGNNTENLQFTAAISSGSSGGALFDEKGNVIGVTYASYTDGQNLNLAIPSNIITEIKDSGTYMDLDSFVTHVYPGIKNLYKCESVKYIDILEKPDSYENKFIATTAYVVAVWEDNILVVPDEQWVSLFDNLSFDSFRSLSETYSFNETGIIHCSSSYMNNTIKPGDLVLVGGELTYNESLVIPEKYNDSRAIIELAYRLNHGNYVLPEGCYVHEEANLRVTYYEVINDTK